MNKIMQRAANYLKQFLFNTASLLSFAVLLPTHLFLANVSSIFSFADGSAAIWPSAGIFLAAALILRYRVWLPIFIADWISNETLYYQDLRVSFLISAIDTIEIIGVSVLILHFVKRIYPFNRVSTTLKYLALLVPVTLLTGVMAVITLCLFNISSWNMFGSVLRGWICGILTSEVVLTPFVLSTWNAIQTKRWDRSTADVVELVAIFCSLLLTGLAAFAGAAPVEYILIFPLLWAAIRFSPREVTFLSLVMSIIAVHQTLNGNGSFAQSSAASAVVLLQSFVVSLTIAALVLSAAMQENRKVNQNLRQANDDLEHRVEVRTEELTETLQKLKQAQAQMVQQEKMSGLGQMVAGVAHEINNPVNFIHGNLQHVGRGMRDIVEVLNLYETHYPNPEQEISELVEELDIEFVKEDLESMLAAMRVGTSRIREIVLSLRTFSRLDESDSKAVDIHEGLESTLMLLQHRIKARASKPAVSIVRDYDALPLVECYAGQLNQVFMNVLVNSLDALESKQSETSVAQKMPQITLRTEKRAETVVIAIADNGTGIPEDVKRRIFDPFFTTKAVGKGTGLGMAISYQIVTEKHKGKIECFSEQGVGTEFTVEIPVQLSKDI